MLICNFYFLLFVAIACGQDDIIFPDQLETRFMPVAGSILRPQQDFSGQYDNAPPASLQHDDYQDIQPPRYDGNPCYYNRPNILCSPSGVSDSTENFNGNAKDNVNIEANANANSNSGNGNSKSNAQASSQNGFGNSHAQASSQSQGNIGYDNNNNYYPYYPVRDEGGASSASSSASATSGIVNGVPVAASSASAAAAFGGGKFSGGSSATASSSSSASSSGIYDGYKQPNNPWFYSSRIGNSDEDNKTSVENEDEKKLLIVVEK